MTTTDFHSLYNFANCLNMIVYQPMIGYIQPSAEEWDYFYSN